jgi:hypothetical protein
MDRKFIKDKYYKLKPGLNYDWCKSGSFGNPKDIRFIVKCTINSRYESCYGYFKGVIVESNLNQVWLDIKVCKGTHDEWDMSSFEECDEIVYNRDYKLKRLGIN